MVDITASISAASSGTSGAQTGDRTSGGGLKIPKWIVPLAIVCVFVFAVVKVLRS